MPHNPRKGDARRVRPGVRAMMSAGTLMRLETTYMIPQLNPLCKSPLASRLTKRAFVAIGLRRLAHGWRRGVALVTAVLRRGGLRHA